jgi:uncharacterized protein (DUF885 family)
MITPWFRLLSLLAIVALVAASCTSVQRETASAIIPFDTLANRYYEEFIVLNPFSAMSLGDNRYNHTFPNTITKDYIDRTKAFYNYYKHQLSLIDRSSLAQDDQLNYEVMLNTCTINLERLEFPFHLLPMNQFTGWPLTMGIYGSGKSTQPFRTVADYDNWLKRLNGYSVWVDSAIVNMKQGIALNYVLPEALTLKMIPQMETFAKGPAENHLFFGPVANFPDSFSPADRDRLTARYTAMISDTLIPMYEKLTAFIRDEYLPASRKTSGISEIPKGKSMYEHLIRYYTTTDITAREVFALGHSEVARIEAELEKVKQEVGFKGTLKEFFVHLRTKKELMPFRTPEEVLDNFNRIHERMRPRLRELFNEEPKTPFEVRRTEAFREKSAAAQYFPGAPDGSRAGIFYVPIPSAPEYNVLQDETLFLHEAIPGHHYQIMLQLENTNIPKFRNLMGYTAYAEGWALYTESLGRELGLYTDPYQYFGTLSAEIHRAIRLVVDAGIHSQGWSREQAIRYSLDHEPEPEESIVAEIERYMAIPGQALSYKIGQLKIRELRQRCEQELGGKFNIGEFHDQVLNTGSIPLSVLEAKIIRWMTEKKQTL